MVESPSARLNNYKRSRIMESYRDLIVWQKSIRLVKEVYLVSSSFPNKEVYGLTAQIQRSAVSIPSNIAEGYGRHSTPEYIRYLRVACGSLYEMQTQLEIALSLDYLEKNQYETLFEMSREIERMLSSLISKLVKNKSEGKLLCD